MRLRLGVESNSWDGGWVLGKSGCCSKLLQSKFINQDFSNRHVN